MRIDEVLAGRGQRGRGWLPVGEGLGWWDMRLPVMWVTGQRSGPTLVVSAAVHGDEYEGGAACRRLWRDVAPQDICGSLVMVPAVNVLAHRAGTRTSPVDLMDMNRVFPGRMPGTMTEMIAHAFFHEIVCRADCLVDLHAGGLGYSMLPLAVMLEEGDEEFRAREWGLVKATGLGHVWKGAGKWPAAHTAAIRRGIPGVLLELGEEGRLKPDRLELGLTAVRNVMSHLGMMPGDVVPASPVVVRGTFQVAVAGGLFEPVCEAGERVVNGQMLGRTVDVFGEELELFRAGTDGIVCSVRTHPSLEPGQWTVFVGEVLQQ